METEMDDPAAASQTWNSVNESTTAPPKTIASASIVLADGEVLKREYLVTKVSGGGEGEGWLFITDSRLIFVGQASSVFTDSRLVQDIQLQDVNGIMAYKHRGIGAGGLLFLLLLVLIDLGLLLSQHFVSFLIVAGIIAAIVYTARTRTYLAFTIQSRSTQIGAISFGQGPTENESLRGFMSLILRPASILFQKVGLINAIDVLSGYPTAEAEAMMQELGALILDLQSKGRLAETDWASNP